MRHTIAKSCLILSVAVFAAASWLMFLGVEPFYTHFFIFAWGSYILGLDSWLFIKGGESILHEKPFEFTTFLVPFSSLLWFVFEAINLRIQNWGYVGVPFETWIRWPGYFVAFGTVLPGIFLTANALEHFGIFRKNEFSLFFSEEIPRRRGVLITAGGAAMILLPLLWPRAFFPLVWGGFVLLLDPWVAKWKGKSLLQEWRQKNFSRTLQLLLAGLICGGLWEFWNYWAGAKWIYTVPLPEALLKNLKIFEMPLLGFLGFPPFALECFVMAEFARSLRERVPPPLWNALKVICFLSMIAMCRWIDLHTVFTFDKITP